MEKKNAESIKNLKNINTFKHNLENFICHKLLFKQVQNCYCYYIVI